MTRDRAGRKARATAKHSKGPGSRGGASPAVVGDDLERVRAGAADPAEGRGVVVLPGERHRVVLGAHRVGVGVLVFVLWIWLDLPWMVIGESGDGYDPRDDGHVNIALATIRILGAAVVVPIMEELFWRSFVMRWIDKPDFLTLAPAAVTLKGLLLSSVVFGFEHNLWFAGIVAGLAYGWLYRATGNLWVPTIAHAVTNGVLGAWVLYTGAWQFW